MSEPAAAGATAAVASPGAARSGPRHIAIIMDGNGRWAEARMRPRTAGHRAGVRAVRATVECCLRQGIPVLTLFAFSSENWSRPASEVSTLLSLFLRALDREVDELAAHGVRLHFVGDLTAFPAELQRRMHDAEARTAGNDRLTLNIAVNYGGRWDLARAAQRLAARVLRGEIRPEQIDSAALGAELCLYELPEPDLLIRTGGEVRISNFLLWQLAYTELYFTDVLWPDFDAAGLDRAIAEFRRRERRFGRTGAQLRSEHGA